MSKIATIHFYKVIQDRQDVGTDDDFMEARLFFHIFLSDPDHPEIPATEFRDLTADVKQPNGANYEEDPLEVSYPKQFDEYIPRFPYEDAAERCYRKCYGQTASFIHIEGNIQDLRMRNNTFGLNHVEKLSMIDEGGGWKFD